jgi:hypothetical protein
MDTARQLPRLKFVALWGALTLTFAFPAQVFAAPEETITIATLLKGGWQIAGYTSTLDNRSAFILFRHPDEPYLVQCRASYDVTRATSFSSGATASPTLRAAAMGRSGAAWDTLTAQPTHQRPPQGQGGPCYSCPRYLDTTWTRRSGDSKSA